MPATVAGIHLGPDTHANRPAANASGLPVGSLYSCSDHSLIYITDGSAWSTWATLGSVGGGGDYDPDGTPATATAIADEFDDGSLDAAWGWDSAPATVDESTYAGYLFIEGDTNERHLNRAWAPGATDLTLAAKLTFADGAGDTGSVSLYVGDATGNPANAVLEMVTGSTVQAYNENGAGSFAQLISEGFGLSNVRTLYLRLTRLISGPTWRFYFSTDGVAWHQLNVTSTKSLTVAALGFRIDSPGQIAIDWVRAWTSIVTKVGS